MPYATLFIFVEGSDDRRLAQSILIPQCCKRYSSVQVIEYSRKKPDYISKYLRSIQSMRNQMDVDYIVLCDLDEAACITRRKQRTISEYRHLELDRIGVVVQEIEGWYLAGLHADDWERLKIRGSFESTEGVTKEDFNRLMPSKFDNRIDFMVEILKHFSHEVAQGRNISYRYFAEKMVHN